MGMHKQPSLIYTVIFFLKTTLFNIVVNPTLAIFVPFIIIFVVTKDVDNRALLFLMIVFCFTFQFTRSFNLSLHKQFGNKTDVSIFYRLLPVKNIILSKALIITIIIYAVTINSALIFSMYKSNELPDVQEIVIHYNQETAITSFTGSYLDARGFKRTFTQYYFPSLFFGIVNDINSWQVFPGYVILLPMFFITLSSL
jgi:hypothetical protein